MKVPEQHRITSATAKRFTYLGNLQNFISDESYGNNGVFFIPYTDKILKTAFFIICICSDGMGWDHVSVAISLANRCPTWEEMCYIKHLFWDKSESVMQIHPSESEYVNISEFCLHLWKPQNILIPLPDSIMVGIKSKQSF